MNKTEGRQRNAWPGVVPGPPEKIYGPRGEILIGSPVNTDAFLWKDPTGRVHLDNSLLNFGVLVEGAGNVHLASNVQFDSVAGAWNRFNAAAAAGDLGLFGTNRQWQFISTPAGANPVTGFPGETDLFHGDNGTNHWGLLQHGTTNQDNFLMTTRGLLYMGSNVTTPDGGTTWNRLDTTLGVTMVQYQRSTGYVVFFYAPPGANPIPSFTQYGMNIGVTVGWTGLPWSANWGDFGGGEALGAYRISPDGNGRVFLKGLVRKTAGGVANDIIATLPVGARPSTEHIFIAQMSPGGSNNAVEVRINVLGNIYLPTSGINSTTWTSLSQIAFDLGT